MRTIHFQKLKSVALNPTVLIRFYVQIDYTASNPRKKMQGNFNEIPECNGSVGNS